MPYLLVRTDNKELISIYVYKHICFFADVLCIKLWACAPSSFTSPLFLHSV